MRCGRGFLWAVFAVGAEGRTRRSVRYRTVAMYLECASTGRVWPDFGEVRRKCGGVERVVTPECVDDP